MSNVGLGLMFIVSLLPPTSTYTQLAPPTTFFSRLFGFSFLSYVCMSLDNGVALCCCVFWSSSGTWFHFSPIVCVTVWSCEKRNSINITDNNNTMCCTTKVAPNKKELEGFYFPVVFLFYSFLHDMKRWNALCMFVDHCV